MKNFNEFLNESEIVFKKANALLTKIETIHIKEVLNKIASKKLTKAELIEFIFSLLDDKDLAYAENIIKNLEDSDQIKIINNKYVLKKVS